MLGGVGTEGRPPRPLFWSGWSGPLPPAPCTATSSAWRRRAIWPAARRGKTNRYTPLVEREAYRRQEGRTILGKLYEGSLKRFAAALHDGGALDQSEVEELRAYLDELEEKGGM